MSDRHCPDCGGELGELTRGRGSDVIPTSECEDCGGNFALACDCDDPEGH